ncbi:MAG: TetR/AcrR family transcriptional regulator C-terminal domain-containing protein [Eubacterium sp.]|nr:TetR/AcrR family transcriptional regulator C-terminal domain-containing protein [Eubacterium sp.]
MAKESACTVKTKKKMAAALKRLMVDNAFEKITVSEITDACQLHRQTFYYHFQDRYELLDWLLYNELIEPFVTDISLDNIYSHFYQLLDTMYRDKQFYQNALKINMSDLINYISGVSKTQFTLVISQLRQEHDLLSSSEADMVFGEFFGYGLAGVVLNWVQGGMEETPDKMAMKVRMISEMCKEIEARRDK